MCILLSNSGALTCIRYSFFFVLITWVVFLEGLPSHEEVMVKYVDFGNIGNITLKDIRRVKKEFLSFPEKVN